jgi:hypothetical protein
MFDFAVNVLVKACFDEFSTYARVQVTPIALLVPRRRGCDLLNPHVKLGKAEARCYPIRGVLVFEVPDSILAAAPDPRALSELPHFLKCRNDVLLNDDDVKAAPNAFESIIIVQRSLTGTIPNIELSPNRS